MARGRRFQSIEDFDAWLAEVAGSRLNRRRSFEGGNWAAPYDAVAQALDDHHDEDSGASVRVPRWALEALLDRWLEFAPATKRRAKEWQRDSIDWVRFRQVLYRRIARREGEPEHTRSTKAQRQERARYQTRAAAKDSRFRVDLWTPYPWEAGLGKDDLDVFEAVQKIFEGSAYAGSPGEMKKSWERVNAALTKGQAWRYYPAKWLRYAEEQLHSADANHAK